MKGSDLCILLFLLGSIVQCSCECGGGDKRGAMGFSRRDHPSCPNHQHWDGDSCQCVCKHGFTGLDCQTQIDSCHSFACRLGYCIRGDDDKPYCTCETGYNHFIYCTEFDRCRSVYCGSGTCMMKLAHVGLSQIPMPQCSCPYGYYGLQCENYDPCYSYACNTGTCQIQANTARCTCPAGYSGDHCEIVLTTTPTTTTTTTPQPTIAPIQYTCTTTHAINDLATNVKSNNTNASSCTTGDHAGSDAFVLNHCNVVKQPAAWKQGLNVMNACSSVPIYTPIATFTNNQFIPRNDTAAIFLGCLGNDIRIGLQTCDAGTRIEHFKVGGPDYRDASRYYVIQ